MSSLFLRPETLCYYTSTVNETNIVKTKKPPAKKRAPAAAKKAAAQKSARPLHKRILLHPFSVMILLCAGVIIAGTTYHSFASSYQVTARVDAPVPTVPAVIAVPADQYHTTADQIDITGTCPAASYVVVFRTGQAAGTSPCVAGGFQTRIGLAYGANTVQAKVYNITNLEGPASAPSTVYRDPIVVPTPPPPVVVPVSLQIQNVEKSSFNPAGTPAATTTPTVTGYAPPYSDIVVTFHSNPVTCITKADATGWWSCTLERPLPAGTHHVDVTAVTPAGIRLSYPTFEIVVQAQLPSLLPQRRLLPLVTVDYQYQTHYPGQPFTWNIHMQGGAPPFAITFNWGDGSQSTLTRNDDSVLTVTHAFPKKETYTVFVKSTDATGQQAIMQLFAIVRGEDGSVAAVTKPNPLIGPLATLQKYLWIVWPAYIAVLLMVLSYWLGEKEMQLRFGTRRLAHHGPTGVSHGRGRRL